MIDEQIKLQNKKIFDYRQKIEIKNLNSLQKNDISTEEQKPNFINNHNYYFSICNQKKSNRLKMPKKYLSMKKMSNKNKYIINLIRQNIQKRNNILPKIKISIFNQNFITINSERKYETEENNLKKIKMNNFAKNIKYNKLPQIAKSFQYTEEKSNTKLVENDMQIINNNINKNKNNSSSINSERQNKNLDKIIKVKNKISEEFFKNIEKNMQTKKNYIDVNNMIERIEDLKNFSKPRNRNENINNYNNENNNTNERGKFFISETIDYNKNYIDSLKKELGIETKNHKKYEEEKDEKNNEVLLSRSEIEKLKNTDKKIIFDINKKLINKEKIIDLCKINEVPDSIFDGRYKNIKQMEMISHKILSNKLTPLRLGKSSSMKIVKKEII